MTDPDEELARLEADELRVELASFDHADAFALGMIMVDRARQEGLGVIVEVRRPALVLFRVAVGRVTGENEAWLDRKARTVFRYETSTALVGARFATQGVDPWSVPWFDADAFTPAGGSVPVRVRGVGVVAAVTVSGLTGEQDHAMAMDALLAFAAGR